MWYVFLAGNTLGWVSGLTLEGNYRRNTCRNRRSSHVAISVCRTGDLSESYTGKANRIEKGLDYLDTARFGTDSIAFRNIGQKGMGYECLK